LLGPGIDDAGDVADVYTRDAIAEGPPVENDVAAPFDQFNDSPIPTGCPSSGPDSTRIYLISSENELFSFYPPTLDLRKVGDISCAGANGATPYSMAVNRAGTAYSVFSDGTLWQISTADASCAATPYAAALPGAPFRTFGMGYTGDLATETLFVCDARFSGDSAGLARIDTTTFGRTFVADFNPMLPRCELTGTSDGRLFAFCLPTSSPGSILAEIDPTTANVITETNLPLGAQSDAFAFAFWGGVFWVFLSPGGPTTVSKYDPQTHELLDVSTINSTIVGAGVSTCAPR
jgi:hypothetical protein